MEFVTEPPENLALRAESQAVSWRKITLVDPLVSESGTPSGLRREHSLRAYDGVVNVVGNPSPTISGVPKPSPIRWFERVSAATSFYAAFRPLFRQIGR
jgi:hypothetical protein